jgi:hypothetical protein
MALGPSFEGNNHLSRYQNDAKESDFFKNETASIYQATSSTACKVGIAIGIGPLVAAIGLTLVTALHGTGLLKLPHAFKWVTALEPMNYSVVAVSSAVGSGTVIIALVKIYKKSQVRKQLTDELKEIFPKLGMPITSFDFEAFPSNKMRILSEASQLEMPSTDALYAMLPLIKEEVCEPDRFLILSKKTADRTVYVSEALNEKEKEKLTKLLERNGFSRSARAIF